MEPLFELGDFVLHSGGKTFWRINCDRLNDADIETLAAMVAERLPVPNIITHPVSHDGSAAIRLAEALGKYRQPIAGVLIVDDVLTTGKSMEEIKDRFVGPVRGAVIFARGPCPKWVIPLFSTEE